MLNKLELLDIATYQREATPSFNVSTAVGS